MLHLAQVKSKNPEGKVELKLLAQQKAEYAWVILSDDDNSIWLEAPGFNEGTLVLLELSQKRQVQRIHSATRWLMEVIEDYLSAGMSPSMLQEEVQRAEQWRQSLTLQSQELGRRTLEMEARREQIQELEESLKQEKLELEARAAQLQELEEHLHREKEQLDRLATQMRAKMNGAVEVQHED